MTNQCIGARRQGSGLGCEAGNMSLHGGHSQLQRITSVTDHALDAQLNCNAVYDSAVKKNVIDLAGDGQQEPVTLNHASHRSAVATSVHGQCGVVGVRQSTCVVRDWKEPTLALPEPRRSIGPAFRGIERSGYSSRRSDSACHGFFPSGEFSSGVYLLQEDRLSCRIDQAHGFPQVRHAAVLASHRHKPKHTLVLVHPRPSLSRGVDVTPHQSARP